MKRAVHGDVVLNDSPEKTDTFYAFEEARNSASHIQLHRIAMRLSQPRIAVLSGNEAQPATSSCIKLEKIAPFSRHP